MKFQSCLLICYALIARNICASELQSSQEPSSLVIALDIESFVNDEPQSESLNVNFFTGLSMVWNFGTALKTFNDKKDEMRDKGLELSKKIDGACNVTKQMLTDLILDDNYGPKEIKLLTEIGVQPKIKDEGCAELKKLSIPLIACTSHDPYHQELFMGKLGKHCLTKSFKNWIVIPYTPEAEKQFKGIKENYVVAPNHKDWFIAKETYPSRAYLETIRYAADTLEKDSKILLFSSSLKTPSDDDLAACKITFQPYVSIDDIKKHVQ